GREEAKAFLLSTPPVWPRGSRPFVLPASASALGDWPVHRACRLQRDSRASSFALLSFQRSPIMHHKQLMMRAKSAGRIDKKSVGETPNAPCTDHLISSPVGSWSDLRNVFTNSPSPQTIISGNRLNQRTSGTSGSVSSHRASNPSWEVEISRSRTRFI